MKKYNNKLDEYEYKILKERTNKLIKISYQNYLNNIQENVTKNPKYFWAYIKSKRNSCGTIPKNMKLNDLTACDGNGIANLFAQNIASVYALPSQSNPHNSATKGVHNCSMLSNIYLTQTDVQKHLKNLDISKGAGADGIPPIFFKECAACLSVPLQIIYNRSLSEGQFPELWKDAIVVPIPKAGDKSDVCNYRPISILSVPAKVFESLMCPLLNWHIKQTITSHQHGFIKNRSTATNLTKFIDRTVTDMSNGNEVDAVYSDISKAFDKVDHNILIQKLGTVYGVQKPLLKWFASYLTQRKSKVVVNGYASDVFIPTSGVPQGSHLGPVLFIMFIDDIKHSIHHSHFEIYADDLKLYRIVNSEKDQQLLQEDINNLCNWCNTNAMQLNINKCYHIKFSRRKHHFQTAYDMNGQMLSTVTIVRDLGILIDSEMRLNMHVDDTVNKCYRMLSFINRNTGQFRSISALTSLYAALVRSHIEYCSIVWYPTYQNNIQRIEGIQKKFVKRLSAVTNTQRTIKLYDDRLNHFKMKSLHWRRDFLGLTFLYKVVNGGMDCPDLVSQLNINVPRSSARLHNYRPFVIKTSKNNYGYNSPFSYILRKYNDLLYKCDLDIFGVDLGSFKNALFHKM